MIKPESLAYWYFRLNGFLTIENFIVHSEAGGGQRTDADILGVRFPYRAELMDDPMIDDGLFTRVNDKPFIVIAEVKKGVCGLNGPWKDRERQNLQRVLLAIGAFQPNNIGLVAEHIYENGFYENEDYYVTLIAVGSEATRKISDVYPMVPQVIWHDVLTFIHVRFDYYYNQKAHHPQWDGSGRWLWNCFNRNRNDINAFIAQVVQSFPTRQP